MTVSPTVTCPSPPIATLPLRRTARMVVARMRGRLDGAGMPKDKSGWPSVPARAAEHAKRAAGTRPAALFVRSLANTTGSDRCSRWKFGLLRSTSGTGEEHQRAVVAVLEVRTDRVDRIDRAAVLPNLATHVAEALAAAERPEALFTEEQRRRVVLRRRRRSARPWPWA